MQRGKAGTTPPQPTELPPPLGLLHPAGISACPWMVDSSPRAEVAVQLGAVGDSLSCCGPCPPELASRGCRAVTSWEAPFSGSGEAHPPPLCNNSKRRSLAAPSRRPGRERLWVTTLLLWSPAVCQLMGLFLPRSLWKCGFITTPGTCTRKCSPLTSR